MTQAFNLSQLANKVNTSGQLDASTGLSSAVPVANGGLALTSIAAKSIPVANSANTYTTVTPAAGQSVRVNAGNTAWEAFTPGTGTVTSVATGNGLQGGTITSSGTLSIAAPSAGSVGSYAIGTLNNTGSQASFGSSYSTIYTFTYYTGLGLTARSGTWMCMGNTGGFLNANCTSTPIYLFVRVV